MGKSKNTEPKALPSPKRPKHITPTGSYNVADVKYTIVDGVEYYDRNCTTVKVHTPHSWKTYYFNSPAPTDPENAWCDGSGKPPVYTHRTYTSTYVKKDYSKDAENFPHSNPITITQARKIAYDMHKNDKDKAGEPYRLHLHAVEQGVIVLGGTKEERIAALFHDAVEDFHTTYDILRKIHVSEESIKIIEAVSKRTSEEQSKYRDRVIAAGHGACRVKLADLLHNTRHDRLEALKTVPGKGQTTVDRLLKKYRPFIASLMLELGIIVDEDEQKKLATKPQGSAGTYTYAGYSSSTYKKDGLSSDWEVNSLFRGDWVSFWSAPIIDRMPSEKKDHTIFILANGEYRDEPHKTGNQMRKLKTYAFKDWATNAKITFTGVTDDMIFDYAQMVDAMKPDVVGEEDFLWDAGL